MTNEIFNITKHDGNGVFAAAVLCDSFILQFLCVSKYEISSLCEREWGVGGSVGGGGAVCVMMCE